MFTEVWLPGTKSGETFAAGDIDNDDDMILWRVLWTRQLGKKFMEQWRNNNGNFAKFGLILIPIQAFLGIIS